MNREDAELFCEVFGQTVDHHRAAMAAAAQKWINAGRRRYVRIDARRWAVDQLGVCANWLSCPPPPELVSLVALQLNIGKRPKKGQILNRKMWRAAIHYVASHPGAIDGRTIAGEIGFGKKKYRVVEKWLASAGFQDLARKQRALLALEKDSLPG